MPPGAGGERSHLNPGIVLARSYLFAPGNDERLLRKVFTAGADAVVLDLEDAVAADRKQQARKLVAEALGTRRGENTPIYVRINSVSSGLWRQDVEAVVTSPIFGVRLAKAESAEEVHALNQALSAAEARAGLPDRSIRVVPTIESAAGVLAAREIARMARVEALVFGAVDFFRDIGAETDLSGTAALYAQSYLVLVSRAAGLNPPIAPAYTRVEDVEGLRATSEAARRLGFFGRSCIHPRQIPVVHEVFTPTAEQVAGARAVVEAFERATAKGSAAFVMEGDQFVDEAIVKRARAVLNLAAHLTRASKAEEN
ncbi:MAG TPA: CoA ester lyase [Candidatus Dormibacteraeota bacterium]|nr:CoA ester lyase [Candidatus Dormibacteraeota bacterium]